MTLGSGGLALTAAVVASFVGGPLAWGIAALALASGIGSWLFNYFVRRLEFVRRYVDGVNVEHERARMASLGKIRATLFDLAQAGDGADLAARGLAQFQRVHVEQETFNALLVKKLNVGELTYTRYINAVDSAYELIVDNLAGIVDRLRAIGDIDRGALDAQIKRLESGGSQAPSELTDLRTRVALQTDRISELETMIGANESAITALIGTSAAVAGMRDLDRGDGPSLDLIIGDLERLAERAKLD